MNQKIKPNLGALNRRNEGVVAAISNGSEPPPTGNVIAPLTVSTALNVEQLKPGQAYSVPVHLIRRSEIGARIFYKAEEVDQMILSLKAQRQLTPATGYVSGDRVVIIDGGKRHTACTQGGIDELIIFILPPPENKTVEYVRSFVANHVRSEQTQFDDAVRFQALLDSNYIKSQDELADLLQVSKSTVSKTLRLAKIPDVYRRFMIDNAEHFPLSIAYALAPIFDVKESDERQLSDEQKQDVLEEVCRRQLSLLAVEDLVRNLSKPKASRTRSQQITVQIGDQKGVLKINRDKGDLIIQFKGVSPAKIDVIESKLPDWLKRMGDGN